MQLLASVCAMANKPNPAASINSASEILRTLGTCTSELAKQWVEQGMPTTKAEVTVAPTSYREKAIARIRVHRAKCGGAR